MNETHLSFQTSGFVDGPEARAERVNEGIGGHVLAVWLSGKLREAGLAASEPWVEDHGWDFDVRHGGRTYLCVCEIEDDDSSTREAHVQLDLSQSLMDRLRGRNRFDAETDPIAKAVEKILRGSPEILDIKIEVPWR